MIENTYQLNIGGDTDFENMTVEDRLRTKRISKTEAVKSLLPYDVPTRNRPLGLRAFPRRSESATSRLQVEVSRNVQSYSTPSFKLRTPPTAVALS